MSDFKTYYTAPISKLQNTPAIDDYINAFLTENPEAGTIIFEVHNDNPVRGRVPVTNAKITISKQLGDDFYLSKVVMTNENGETDPIQLPTVSRELSQSPGERRVFENYWASIEAPGFQRLNTFDIQIFDGITSIQHINLQPIGDTDVPARPTSPPAPARPTSPTAPVSQTAPARPVAPSGHPGWTGNYVK